MNQHHVLRVFCKQRRFEVEGMQGSCLTHCTMTLPVIFGWIEQK